MEKRGQVTLYIVIAIVIVAIILILIFSKGNLQLTPEKPTVSSEIKPVTLFIEQCIKDNTEKALNTAMEHGGYIYFDNMQANPIDPTESKVMEFVPNTGFMLPYWYYMESKNNCRGGCSFGSMAKPLCKPNSGCITDGDNSVELELERYLNENLEKCFMDFRAFGDKGYSIAHPSAPKAVVTIRRDSALVSITYPVTIEYKGSRNDINSFNVEVPSLMSSFYKAALDIQDYAANNCFVENHMINIISLYSGLGKDIPPFSGSTSDLSDAIWIKPTVKTNVDRLAATYVQLIRVGNTSSNPYPDVGAVRYKKLEQGISDQFTFYPLKEFTDMSIKFSYFPWWNTYFNVEPSTGSVIGPSDVVESSGNFLTNLMGSIISKQYDFFYEYSFPVAVELRALDAYGKMKVFRFALESNIRGNKCFHPDTGSAMMPAVADSLLCDTEFFGDKNFTISVKDEFTKKPLDMVSIYYYAGDTCSLGATSPDGTLITMLPASEGGYVKFEKLGYLSRFLKTSDLNTQMTVLLKPLIEKNVSLNIFNMTVYDMMSASSSPLSVRDANINAPSEYDTVIVQIDRVRESYQDPEYSQVVAFSENKTAPSTVKLPTGEYTFSINLFLMKNVPIVAEHDRYCEPQLEGILGSCVKTPVDDSCSPRGNPDDLEGDFKRSNCYLKGYTCESISEAMSKKSDFVKDNQYAECMGALPGIHCTVKWCATETPIDLPAVNMSSIPNGGALMNGTNGYWTISDYKTLNSSKNVNFYILRQKIPVRHHELEDMDVYEQISMDNPAAFKPKLK